MYQKYFAGKLKFNMWYILVNDRDIHSMILSEQLMGVEYSNVQTHLITVIDTFDQLSLN